MKAYIASMGCPKNLVDSEASLSLLRGAGCGVTDDPRSADLLIVNACSFLDAAWQETVDEVCRLAEFKQEGSGKKLVLMGCLPNHRGEDLRTLMPHVDQFVASGLHGRLPELVERWRRDADLSRWSPATDSDRFAGFESRALLTPPHTAYVKIAEGCNRRCTFCAIPKIRGRMVSRSVASVVREVENLIDGGVKEVSLLAQDITSYNDAGMRFPELVSAIAATGVEWIRIFYLHPGSLSLDLARRLFEHPAVCRYLEAPVQHAADRVLKRMRRPYTRARLMRLFESLYREFPDLRVRSEVMVGFPGEDDDDFEALKAFVEWAGFSSLGIFTYSREQSTVAASLDGQVPESLKTERAAELSDLQASVAFAALAGERGRIHRVLIDRSLPEGERIAGAGFSGRYYGQAYEVDGDVRLPGAELPVGDFVQARIVDADLYELRGEVV